MKTKVTQRGEIVELTIRRNNISISELSRKLNVSRRSIYNWFTQKSLSIDIICKIGEVIKHDFSKDFPEIFNQSMDLPDSRDIKSYTAADDYESVNYWRNKYINLLEKHNDFLSHHNPMATLITVLYIFQNNF